MKTKNQISFIAALTMIGSLVLVAPAFAENNQQDKSDHNSQVGKISVSAMIGDGNNNQDNQDKNDHIKIDLGSMMPSIVGKVSAKSGNILTVVSARWFNKIDNKTDKTNTSATTTFTVDATNAKLLRGNTTIALADISIGDNIVIQGTITGTNVVATVIRDGKVGNGNGNGDANSKDNKDNEAANNQAMLQIQGNGQPVVAGTISIINGSTITITTASNITYTINAANAKFIQGSTTIALSGVKVGDSVIVQGAVNGTAVTASTVIDTSKIAGQTIRRGFFGSIGQFFKHLFGF